jgi:protein-L-isoaspartate O-methyltransferase
MRAFCDAFRAVPRESFLPAGLRAVAIRTRTSISATAAT